MEKIEETPVTTKQIWLVQRLTRLSPLINLASPMIFNAFIREIAEFATIIYVGKTGGALAIGAQTIGNMMCNITGFSLAYGLCSALDTLIAQAFGAKAYQQTGLFAQRAAAILTLASIPVAMLWSQTHIILEYVLAIPHDTAIIAGAWSGIITLGLWPSLMFIILTKWLQGQNVVWPVVLSSISTTIFNVVLNYVMMIHGFGFEGVALTYALTQWFSFLMLCFVVMIRKYLIKRNSDQTLTKRDKSGDYNLLPSDVTPSPDLYDSSEDMPSQKDGTTMRTALVDPEDNWPPLSVMIFRDWGEFLRLGIPGAASMFIEWGSFELGASIAAQLGPVPLAVHGIFCSTASMFYLIPQAVALATATLVGNALGASNPEAAACVVRDGIFVDFLYGLISGLILFTLLRPFWGSIFTDDNDVKLLVYRTMPMMALYAVVDSTKCVTLNVLRSTGRPQITVWGNSVSCVCIMLPLGYLLAIKFKYGLPGLWFALSTAWFLITVVYTYVVLTSDWRNQIILMKEENHAKEIDMNMDDDLSQKDDHDTKSSELTRMA
jgi:MATE family multidrug resistance protein